MSEFDLGYSMCANAQERTASIDLVQLDKKHAAVLSELLICCLSWEPQVCVLGNVRAGDAAEAIQQLLARRSLTSGAPAEPASSAEQVRNEILEEAASICDINVSDCCCTAEHCAEDIRALILAGAAAKTEQAPEHETIVQEGGNLVCTACGTTAISAVVGFDSNMQKVDIATAAGAGSAQPEALNEIFAAIDEAQRMNRYNESSFEIASRVARLKCLADNYRAAMRANDGAAEGGK